MLDMHCHVLFDIDDGCKTLEDSVQLCSIAVQNGITHIAATPHFLTFFEYEDFFEKRNRNVRILMDELKKQTIPLKLMIGAEVACSKAMFHFDMMKRLAINSGRYLLLELPFADTELSELTDYVGFVFDCGLVPIIAHPERYTYVQKDYNIVNELSDQGCLFQINSTSLCGLFGKRARAMASEMIRCGFADIIATDAHSPHSRRKTDFLHQLEQFPQELISDDALDKMTRQTPALIAMNKAYKPERGEYIRKHIGDLLF